MPSNKFASAYINQAYERMVALIQQTEVPAFTLYPTADQFECAKSHAQDIARAVDEYIFALANEAKSNSTTPISIADRASIVSNALHDSSLLDELQEAADAQREDELERA